MDMFIAWASTATFASWPSSNPCLAVAPGRAAFPAASCTACSAARRRHQSKRRLPSFCPADCRGQTLTTSLLGDLAAALRDHGSATQPAQSRHHGPSGYAIAVTRRDGRDSTDVRYQTMAAVKVGERVASGARLAFLLDRAAALMISTVGSAQPP